MFKKICVFYAFGFFVCFSLFLGSIVLHIRIKPLDSLVFVSLLGLTFSFPITVVSFLLVKLSGSVRNFLRIVFIFLAILILIGFGLFLLARFAFRSGQKASSTPTLAPVLTGDVIEDSYGLEFQEPSFALNGSLFLVSHLRNVNRYQLIVYKNSQKNIFDLEHNQAEKAWKPRSDQSLREFFYQEGKARSLFEPNGNEIKYDFQSDSFVGVWTGDRGYIRQCVPAGKEKEVCFEHRSVYFNPLENRTYD